MNKASAGGEIPAELFQILKDDAVKVLDSVCQQIWKNYATHLIVSLRKDNLYRVFSLAPRE